MTIDVMPIKTANINVEMRDPDGSKELSILHTSSLINLPTSKSSDPNIVPIPSRLSFATTLEGLQPYDSIAIRAKGTNFSQLSTVPNETQTQLLTINGKHPNPIIDDVMLNAIYANQPFVINGDYLAFPALETIVKFNGPNGILETTTFTGSLKTLSNVKIPAALNTHFGEIEMWVVTRWDAPSGVIEKESNHVNIMLLNRNTSFQTKDGSVFVNMALNTQITDCSSNTDPGGITDVVIESTFGSDAMVTISSNGRSDHYQHFNIASTQSGAPSLGGVALFDNSCRVVAVMSKYTQSGVPAQFILSWLYFPLDPEKTVETHKLEYVGFHYYNGMTHQYAPEMLSLMANAGDGSVVFTGFPAIKTSPGKWIPGKKVYGQVNDMLKEDLPSSWYRSSSSASCTTCIFTPEINGRDASLKVDNTNLLNYTLTN